MPPAVALVAAVAGAAVASAISIPILGAVIGGLVTGAISYLGSQLFKPDVKRTFTAGPKVMFRSGNAPAQVVYGRARVSGPIVFVATYEPNPFYPFFGFGDVLNDDIHIVVLLAAHEIDAVEKVIIGDEEIDVADIGSGDGSVSGGGGDINNGGKYDRSNPDRQNRVFWHLGSDSQTADQFLLDRFDTARAANGQKVLWTTDHRLRGIAYLHVKFSWGRETFPNGIPNVSAVVRGKKVYDPRSLTTAWSNNWALVVNDYLKSADGLACDDDEVDEDTVIAAANICDELVETSAESPTVTQARYTVDGAFLLDSEPLAVLEQMLTAGAGMAPYQQGAFRLYAGAYRTPTITLTADDLRGPVRYRPLPSRDQRFNRVRGTFINADRLYIEDDFPAVENATYEAEDGEEITRELPLPFTTDSVRAQRLAKIMLERGRQGITVELACNFAAIDVVCGEPIMLTLDELGWSSKVFMPLEWRLSENGIDLVLQEEASGSYDWAGGDATIIDDAPDTNLPNPFTPQAPDDVTLTSGTSALFVAGDGTVVTRLLVEWQAFNNSFVDRYEVQWRESAVSPNPWQGVVIPAPADEWYISPVDDGAVYDVRVRALTVLNSPSDWTTVTGHTVIGKTEPPSAPDSFTIETTAGGERRFVWTHETPEPDVTSGGGYQIRYFLGTTSDWDAMTPLHTGTLAASPYETTQLAAGTYTFAIKTVDSTGNESSSAVFISSASLADPPFENLFLLRREHVLLWPGTLTDAFVDDDNSIYPISDGDWTDLPDTWDALAARWSRIVPWLTPIVYTSPEIDLEAEATILPVISVSGQGNATVEVRTAPDGSPTEWTAWGAAAFVTARFVQFRVTMAEADASTPPRIDQVTLAVDAISQVDRYPDVNTATETAAWFESLAAGHFRIGSKSGEHAAITQAMVTAIQSVGPGWTWELLSKAVTVNGEPGAEFKVYNGSGTLADAVLDIELRGPRV